MTINQLFKGRKALQFYKPLPRVENAAVCRCGCFLLLVIDVFEIRLNK